MTAYVLFDNATDVALNKTIMVKLGVYEEYKASEEYFEERGIVKHKYRVIRQDITKKNQPKVFTNMFSEIPGLPACPILFTRQFG